MRSRRAGSLERRRSAAARRLAAVAAGVGVDRLLGERWLRPHPVALFGNAMGVLEARLYADRRRAGAAYAATGLGVALSAWIALGLARRSLSTRIRCGRGAWPFLLVAATYVVVAGRALGDAALGVEDALQRSDLARAQALLPALVGRDPLGLDEAEVSRAVVESVAENTVDAVVAPALWAAALGVPGALAYRALNTLDSMVGHRSPRYERFGWASARLDDLAGWLPARLTALLVAVVRPRSAPLIWLTVRRDAGAHPSPNAGVAEAAFAAALGLRLGGANRYGGRLEDRGQLGRGRAARAEDIGKAVALSAEVTAAACGAMAGLAVALAAGGL